MRNEGKVEILATQAINFLFAATHFIKVIESA
jgi:hypothetical protein